MRPRMGENFAANHVIDQLDRKIKKEKEDKLFDDFMLRRLKSRFEERFGKSRPNPANFQDIYTTDDVFADLQHLESKKRQYSSTNDEVLENKKLAAEVFEDLVIEESMESGWLGKDAYVIPTSHYDDVVNKVDAVAEIHNQEQGSHELGLAMDVTFSKEENEIERKLNTIKNNISEGRAPAMVKYYKNQKGEKRKVFIPKVIVGANADTLRELVDLMDKKSSSSEITSKKAKHDLNFHPFQTKMLYEILEQTKAFGEFARNCRNEKSANSYYKAQKIIESIIKSKDLYGEQINDDVVTKDIVLNTIRNYCEDLNK